MKNLCYFLKIIAAHQSNVFNAMISFFIFQSNDFNAMVSYLLAFSFHQMSGFTK